MENNNLKQNLDTATQDDNDLPLQRPFTEEQSQVFEQKLDNVLDAQNKISQLNSEIDNVLNERDSRSSKSDAGNMSEMANQQILALGGYVDALRANNYNQVEGSDRERISHLQGLVDKIRQNGPIEGLDLQVVRDVASGKLANSMEGIGSYQIKDFASAMRTADILENHPRAGGVRHLKASSENVDPYEARIENLVGQKRNLQAAYNDSKKDFFASGGTKSEIELSRIFQSDSLQQRKLQEDLQEQKAGLAVFGGSGGVKQQSDLQSQQVVGVSAQRYSSQDVSRFATDLVLRRLESKMLRQGSSIQANNQNFDKTKSELAKSELAKSELAKSESAKSELAKRELVLVNTMFGDVANEMMVLDVSRIAAVGYFMQSKSDLDVNSLEFDAARRIMSYFKDKDTSVYYFAKVVDGLQNIEASDQEKNNFMTKVVENFSFLAQSPQNRLVEFSNLAQAFDGLVSCEEASKPQFKDLIKNCAQSFVTQQYCAAEKLVDKNFDSEKITAEKFVERDLEKDALSRETSVDVAQKDFKFDSIASVGFLCNGLTKAAKDIAAKEIALREVFSEKENTASVRDFFDGVVADLATKIANNAKQKTLTSGVEVVEQQQSWQQRVGGPRGVVQVR